MNSNKLNVSRQGDFSYCITLTDGMVQNPMWVHALPIGEQKHPIYGKLSFTPERIRRFAQSVKEKVRGIDPDIDYDHKLDPSKGNIAAGWVRDAEERQDGLWLLVEWTKKALQSISDREYKYFSPEFADEWEDAQGNTFKDVVLGGGLTNRPFLKNLMPINLSEFTAIDQEEVMDRAELARALGLSEDATEDQIKAKIKELSEVKQDKVDLSKLSVSEEDGVLTFSHEKADGTFTYELPKKKEEQTDEEKELAKLAEANPAIARILSEREADRKRLDDLEASNRLSEVSTQLSEVGKDARKVLPPAVQEQFRKVMVRLPKTLSDEITQALTTLVKVGGPVALGENTGTQPPANTGDDVAVEKFLSEVDKVVKEKKLSYRDAVDTVRQQQPDLFSQYRQVVDTRNVVLSEG